MGFRYGTFLNGAEFGGEGEGKERFQQILNKMRSILSLKSLMLEQILENF